MMLQFTHAHPLDQNADEALPTQEIRLAFLRESAWESNPPTTFVTPPTRFEDEGHHQATSALARSVPTSPTLSISVGEVGP
jgi:hypothetical protein